MVVTINRRVKVQIVEVGCCNSYVALTENQYEDLRRSHDGFYCHNGQLRSLPGEIYLEKLERLNSNLRMKVGELKSQHDDMRTIISHKDKRYKRLAVKGVCPDCRRNFVNVARHMKTKHPEVVTA